MRMQIGGRPRGSLKLVVKERIGERGQRRIQTLNRIRWISKHRILRDAGLSSREHPRYVLFDPEMESYTYTIANVDAVLAAIADTTGLPHDRLAAFATETESDPELGDRLASRLRWRFDVKRRPPVGSRLAWYVLVRAMRPTLVIETGIHHGLGSLMLLRALERNATEGTPGQLLSFDRSADAGWMVDRSRYPDWRQIVGSTQDTLESALAGRQVGALFHDSHHTDELQRIEFGAALHNSAPELLLVDGSGGQFGTLERLADDFGGAYREVVLGAVDHWYQHGVLAFALFRPPADA